MLPFRPPPMNCAPVAPGIPSQMPPGIGFSPLGIAPGMMVMRGPPPRGPPPMGFPPGYGPPPMAMMPRGPMPLPMVPIATPITAPVAIPVAPSVALAQMGQISLFVGKLPTDLADSYVRDLLENCGTVVAWKRAIDPVTSKPKGFGFCTYAGAMDALRALRLLNGFPIDSKQVLVKADNKTQAKMDEYTAAMPQALVLQEQERDAELRRELKRLEDERSGLKGGIQNHQETWGDLLEANTRKDSVDDRHLGEKETTETKDGVMNDVDEAPVEVQVQQKMILSEIEKFRLAQDQREHDRDQKRRDAVRERLRHEKDGEERCKATLEVKDQPHSSEQEWETSQESVPEAAPVVKEATLAASKETDQQIVHQGEVKVFAAEATEESAANTKDRERTREREKRDRGRGHSKRVRSHSRSRSRERASRRRYRSRSLPRSRSRSRGRDRDSHRDRKHGRESDRHRRRRRNSSAADEELGGERRSKRRRDSKSEDPEPSLPGTHSPVVEALKPAIKVVMDLKMSLGAPKKEKTVTGPAPSLFKVEEEVEVKPVRVFVPIDFAAEERAAAALAQQRAAQTAAKINSRTEDVKTLIDSIPTDREGLFAYPIDWTAVERHGIVAAKMTPWVTKKVHEYLGEEDATLISFILKKLGSRTTPSGILDELHAILEDDAEAFVKSLWRKLAFEALRA